ncbi:hypothetical protein [Parachitinimonas caeni]|uniref:Uncharacterized protein n=1 Tax=Parachitinimonas caeni TaxID=3031301 RepID=A0ABT7DXG7_9NEIS|nr:hypothetical protein [Parachitinimonas caeni]MDK2124755.1 hypothetical protein [Parachitinimonas caeni]
MHFFLRLLALTLASSFTIATAGTPQGPREGCDRPPPPPPREALDACRGKAAGAVVQIATPRGEKISAKCQLVAVSDAMPGPAGGEQPPKPR